MTKQNNRAECETKYIRHCYIRPITIMRCKKEPKTQLKRFGFSMTRQQSRFWCWTLEKKKQVQGGCFLKVNQEKRYIGCVLFFLSHLLFKFWLLTLEKIEKKAQFQFFRVALVAHNKVAELKKQNQQKWRFLRIIPRWCKCALVDPINPFVYTRWTASSRVISTVTSYIHHTPSPECSMVELCINLSRASWSTESFIENHATFAL